MTTLYYAPGTIALAVHIALEECGAPFKLERLDFQAGEQRGEAYRAINPKGRVPTLVTAHGRLTETASILLYVAQAYPEAGLAPLDDPWALAQIQSVNLYIAATLHVAHAHKLRGERWADDPAAIAEMTRKSPEAVGDSFALVEETMMVEPWVAGPGYSIADPYLYAVARWIEADNVDPARFPKIVGHRARMEERAAVRAALAAQGLAPMS